MKKFLLPVLAFVFCVALFPSAVSATHLMGGNLTYQYLGPDTATGLYNYRITITIYRYCETGSSLLPPDMNIGIYQDDPGNPTGDKLLVQDGLVPLFTIQAITPPNANDTCTFTPNVCVEEGVYQTVISVPANTTGYYFISDRCCRNNNIINLDNPGNNGQAYFAYAPPTSVVNSSPTFAAAPVPFICASDTVTILNQAYDIDGDLLVYNFVVPYNGVADNGNPNPNPPFNYQWPIPVVNYAAGYSLANPFGAGGSATINSSTGLASYFAPNQGFYVLAVEIQEFRNGVLIGITRRDLQIIVIPCPINPAPTLSSGAQINYVISEGETLCFTSSFTDSNGDSLFISHTGDIFNNVITNPPATFTNGSGAGSATGDFCWTTDCSQGRTTPYQFSVNAADNGCPAKVTNIVYTITVNNTDAPASITGPDTLCLDVATGITYSVPNSPGNTHNWFIVNGTINGPVNGTSIDVNFTGPGQALIGATTVNAFGCASDTVTKLVHIIPIPVSNAGPDVQFCSGGSANLGTGSIPGYVYTWSPSTGLNNASSSNPVVTIINPGTSTISTTYVVTTNLSGCISSDTVVVTTGAIPAAVAGPDTTICSGETVMIGATGVSGVTYTWTPATGMNDSTLANPTVTLTNVLTVPIFHLYTLVTSNAFGCSNIDSMYIAVYAIPAAIAGPDITFCSGSSGTIGAPAVGGLTYSWSPSTGLSSSSSGNPTVTHTNISGVNDTLIYVLTTSSSTCDDQDTVTVIVMPEPVSNAGTNQSYCGSGTIQLGTTNTPGYTYSWNPGANLNDSTLSDPILTVSNSGSTPDTLVYIVTTTFNGCVSTDTVQIISGPVAVAVAGADITFCSGGNSGIGGAPITNYTYSWSPSTGLSSSTSSNPVVTLNNISGVNDTLYYVITSDLFGCTDQDTVQVIVRPNPVSIAGPDIILCGGDTVNLGTTTTPGYTYSWNPATNLNSSAISDPQAIINNTSGNPQTITYTVTTTLNGCITSDSVVVTTNPQPVVTASASPVAICLGSTAILAGNGATNYDWTLLSPPQTPVGSGSPLTVTPLVTTTYLVTGTNGFSCTNQDTVTVVVNPLPLVQITSSANTICNGDTITLTANGATTYSWSDGSGNNLGTGTSITVNPTANTTYILNGTDGNSCSDSDSITITVNPAATLTAANGTLSVCPGVTGVQYWVINGNPSSTYNWTLTNGTVVSGQGGDTITVDWSSTSGNGIVSVVEVTDLGCLSEPVTLPVSINVILTPVAPTGPTVFCANTAQGIAYTTLNTPGSTYSWVAAGGTIVSGDGTNSVIVDWTTPGPAVVYLYYNESSTTVTNVCFGTSDSLAITLNPVPSTSAITGPMSICVNDSGVYSVFNTGGSSYNWTIAGGNIVAGNGSNAVFANWTISGIATLTIQETNVFGCIGNPVSISVTVNDLPAANAGTDTEVCIGQGVQLFASGGVNYTWSPSLGLSNTGVFNPVASPLVPVNYIVEVTDGNGCINTDTVFVDVNALPVITLTPNSPICIGGSIQLNAGGGTSYGWSPASSLDNPSIANPVANPVVNTTYVVVVTNSDGCVDSSSVTITVNPLPTAVASADSIICDGSSATLSASGGISFSWSPAGSLNNANIANPVATPGSNTTYTVVVTDVNGCTDDESVDISLNDQPEASFVIDPTVTNASCAGAEITLINTSTSALNYLWLFPDGATTTDVNPTHTFSINGDNYITLTAINNMCEDDTTVNYNSILASNILKNMPNIFTPNGDGFNDCYDFGAFLNFEECSSITIYDRWGEDIYHNGSGRNCWNGRKDNSGEEFPTGTYFITVVLAGEKLKSTITLIR